MTQKKKYFEPEQLENNPFFIAEVGQNHQGDFEMASKYIREFSHLGASAIKFQMRNNKLLFSESHYQKSYDSENAFADTYGEHREKLELTVDELIKLKVICHKHNCAFMVTPFDEDSLAQLVDIGVDIMKIASFDLGNIPFIEKICSHNLPTVLSVGGGNSDEIEASVGLIKDLDDYAILHCVSEYPCPPEKLSLGKITKLKEKYPESVIGISDHFSGISSGPISHMLGARVFEKHVTFSHIMKGTDHAFSLLPEGFRKFVRDINNVPKMVSIGDETCVGNEFVFNKLGKSIVAKVDIAKGDIISSDMLGFVIDNNNGLPVRESHKIIGRKALDEVKAGQFIQLNVIELY